MDLGRRLPYLIKTHIVNIDVWLRDEIGRGCIHPIRPFFWLKSNGLSIWVNKENQTLGTRIDKASIENIIKEIKIQIAEAHLR